MQNLEQWLAATGLPVREERFLGLMPLPAIVFSDAIEVGGADLVNNLVTHAIRIELYAETIDLTHEARVEALLDALPVQYSRDRAWVDSEKYFVTTYELNLTERK